MSHNKTQGPKPIGALSQWRAEVQAGVNRQRPEKPSTWKYDSLWLGAAYEAASLSAQREGLPNAATALRRRAAEVIVAAATEAKQQRAA